MCLAIALGLLVSGSTTSCAARHTVSAPLSHEARVAAIRRASVWQRTDVPSMNLKVGPRSVKGFAFNALVECRYTRRDLSGRTPKFTCVLPDGDEVKVKYGLTNGEVYAEVAATRLLWALGFGADAMFPVRVRCHGCPPEVSDTLAPAPERDGATPAHLTVAAIERKMPGRELGDGDGGGWTWPELHLLPERGVDEARAHRDGLTLLAALLQHTDSKRDQQRLICLDSEGSRSAARAASRAAECRRPFLLISDLGKTFGRANLFNRNDAGSVNLEAWRQVNVWLGPRGCRANLSRSATGSLENPVISDAGRRFLARLLQQLTRSQLVDLFTIARFTTRVDATGAIGHGEVDDWVRAFQDKIRQVAERSCDTSEDVE